MENLPSYRDDSKWPEPRVCTLPSLRWLNHHSSPESGILACSVCQLPQVPKEGKSLKDLIHYFSVLIEVFKTFVESEHLI